jgi:hypothetical protein
MLNNIHNNVNIYYKQINENNVISVIKQMQEEHKKRYFFKVPLETKSKDFLEKNKDMFF